MKTRASIVLFAVLLGTIVNACGQTSAPCGPTTCGGCCDGSGRCEVGTSNMTCGSNGAACSQCQGGLSCMAGTCLPSTNAGGGASSGGGAGGGGGSIRACDALVVSSTLPSSTMVLYRASADSSANGIETYASFAPPNLQGGAVGFRLKRAPGGAAISFPYTGSFDSQPSCTGCAEYTTCTSITSSGLCQGLRFYRAIAGTFTFTRADMSSASGLFRGSVGSTRFVEWNATTNTEIGGGDCFDMNALSFEAQW